jgi:phage shock protein C
VKKVVSVHIAGQILQMEDDGYDNLQLVLKRIRNSSANGNEIAADVERRIYVTIQEQGIQNNVITLEQVNDIITRLGFAGYLKPEPSYFQSRPKQLYRHPTNKVIGGVCGGLASYFDVEAVLIRLAFVVLFFGAGTGLLLYIVLWIVLPMGNPQDLKG